MAIEVFIVNLLVGIVFIIGFVLFFGVIKNYKWIYCFWHTKNFTEIFGPKNGLIVQRIFMGFGSLVLMYGLYLFFKSGGASSGDFPEFQKLAQQSGEMKVLILMLILGLVIMFILGLVYLVSAIQNRKWLYRGRRAKITLALAGPYYGSIFIRVIAGLISIILVLASLALLISSWKQLL